VGPSRRPSARRRIRLRRARLRRTGLRGTRLERKRPARRFGWRWRRNPLRRGTDVAEAWLRLATTLLLCLVPLLGWRAGQSVDRTLQGLVRTQHAERTLVTATVMPTNGHGARAQGSAAADDVLRWTAPDHTVHTETVSAELEVWSGSKVMLWTDRHGTLVPPPLDRATAATHSVLAGIAAAMAAGGALLICHSILMWRLMVRRIDFWEREWARVGQDWGRAGAGG
jgi:hypothetical protein